MSKNRVWPVVVVMTVGLCVGGGCVADSPEPDRILVAGPAVEIGRGGGSGEPGGGVVRAIQMAVNIPKLSMYDSGSSASAQRLRVERSLPPGGAGAKAGEWGVLRQPVEGGVDAVEQRSELTMQLEADGDAVLVRTLEAADKVITTFTPGMLVVPAELSVGQVRSEKFEMVVYSAERPGEERARGEATVTVENLGPERLSTPAGELETVKVRTSLKVNLGQAEVDNLTTSWYAAGLGMVAEKRRERVYVMGVPIRGGGESWILAARAVAGE